MLPTAPVRFVMGKVLGHAIKIMNQMMFGWSLYLAHSVSCEKRKNTSALTGIKNERYHFYSLRFHIFALGGSVDCLLSKFCVFEYLAVPCYN